MKELIEKLEWDSSFFGYQVGKMILDIDNFNKEEFKKEAINYKLVYAYCNEIVNDEEFKLVDEKVTFFQKIKMNKISLSKKNKIRSFDLNQDDLTSLIELGVESGIYSRFKIDSTFSNNEFERLYREWILNSINYKLSFEVLIAVDGENRLLGFITIGALNEKTSEIGLIAVSKEARGRGLAKELINSAINESIKRGYENIEVVTQKNNLPAMNLYFKTNFFEKELVRIYHYWN